jgi:hypothetical protein
VDRPQQDVSGCQCRVRSWQGGDGVYDSGTSDSGFRLDHWRDGVATARIVWRDGQGIEHERALADEDTPCWRWSGLAPIRALELVSVEVT